MTIHDFKPAIIRNNDAATCEKSTLENDTMTESDLSNGHHSIFDNNITQYNKEMDFNLDSLFLSNLATLYLELESQHLVPVSTLDHIVSGIENIHKQNKKIMINTLKISLHRNDISKEVIQSVINDIEVDIFISSNALLNSDHKRKKFHKQQLSYVQPEGIFINSVDGKDLYFHYVPIIDTIKAMHKNQSIEQELGVPMNHKANYYQDFTDDELYRNNEFFLKNPLKKFFENNSSSR